MSHPLIDLDPGLKRLREEGFDLELVNAHLLVHSIPYVNANRQVCRGILAVPYTGTGRDGVMAAPSNHTMHLHGVDFPHHANSGKPMSLVVNKGQKNKRLFEDFIGHHYLSNKPNKRTPQNYFELVTHYHSLFRAEAQEVDANADGRTGKVRINRDPNSPFTYPDTASSRAGITAISERLKEHKLGIIGLGGTGAYVLDLLAKIPVSEIHCFDDDFFEAHNAFRAPGVASLDEVNAVQSKVGYFHSKYSVFHLGVVSHALRIEEHTLEMLAGLTFVFVCIDDGTSRQLITRHLIEAGIPFIDVGIGMDVRISPEGNEQLTATCRVTLGTPERAGHLDRCLDYSASTEEDVYASNIQSAPINSLNASLAVIRWLQYVGVMWDDHGPYQLLLNTNFLSLVRSEEEES